MRLGKDAYLQTLCEFTGTQEEDPLHVVGTLVRSVIRMVKTSDDDLLAI